MTTKFVKEGLVIEHDNSSGSKINSGDVVELQNIVAVALEDIPDGEKGSVKATGVFDLPKASGTSWTQGDTLDWDTSAGKFDKIGTPATGDITGCAVAGADAASSDTEGEVMLDRMPGTSNGDV
jgi:predicted RecA/RadA family phage recombinase